MTVARTHQRYKFNLSKYDQCQLRIHCKFVEAHTLALLNTK